MEEWVYKKYLSMTKQEKDFQDWLEQYAEDIDGERKRMKQRETKKDGI